MKVRFLLVTLAIVLMLAFGSVGCGGDDDGDSPGGSGQVIGTPDGGDDGEGGGDDDGDDDADTEAPTLPPNLGRDLTVEEYFGIIDGIFETADEATDENQAALDERLDSEGDLDSQIDAIQDYLATELEIFSDAIGEMDVLTAPDDLAADHDAFIAAVVDAAGAASDLQFALDDVETEEEANLLIEDFETTVMEITDRSDEACFALQEAADARSVAVELDCAD